MMSHQSKEEHLISFADMLATEQVCDNDENDKFPRIC